MTKAESKNKQSYANEGFPGEEEINKDMIYTDADAKWCDAMRCDGCVYG